MSKGKSKHVKHVPAKQAAVKPVVREKRKRDWSGLRRLVWPVYIVALWLLLWIAWGDVLYMANEYSYFTFDRTSMQYVWLQWDGIVLFVGRGLLTLCHFPVLGTLVLALCLSGCGWLLARCGRGHLIATIVGIVLPLLYVGWLMKENLCTFYEAEPGYIFGRPVCVLVALVVIAALSDLLLRRVKFNLRPLAALGCIAGTIVLVVLLAVYADRARQNHVITTKMQRALEVDDYDRMIDLALGARRASRTVAAYYVLALSQTNQVVEKAFDLYYQYPDMELHSREGRPVSGAQYYSPDVDYYAGLPNSAYHEALERQVMEGPSVWHLKRMTMAAIVNREPEVAAKLMHMIRLHPFQKRFVERYSPYIFKGVDPKTDPTMASVMELVPLRDTFEQSFKQPLFLGYNSVLTEGRSLRALTNSIMTCLYAKNKQTFGERLPVLKGRWPRIMQEAYLVFHIRDADIMQDPRLDPIVVATMSQFMEDLRPILKLEKTEIAKQLREKYLGFYPYYYYYENIPEQTKQYDEEVKDNTAR